MTLRKIAFAPESPTTFLEFSEGKWHSIDPSALGLPADLVKESDNIWRRCHEDALSGEELWNQSRNFVLRALETLGEGFQFCVHVDGTSREITPSIDGPTDMNPEWK